MIIGSCIMRIIDWNTKWLSNVDQRIEHLKGMFDGQSTIAILQEVKPTAIDGIRSMFEGVADVRYSLDHRPPGRYDSGSRKLGIVIIVSSDMKVVRSDVLSRSLMPDRTLMVDVKTPSGIMRIIGLHSITGCEHKKAKTIQFLSFAECVDDLHPDVVAFDANEPEVDSPTIDGKVFWMPGAKVFFESMESEGLVDALVKYRDLSGYVDGTCIEVSHETGKGHTVTPRRYDHVFIRADRFSNGSCTYDLQKAYELKSDHALVVVDTDFSARVDIVDGSDEVCQEYYPDYNPGIDGSTWKELVSDPSIFTERSLRILDLMMEMGGEATCTQLAARYGGDYGTYRNILTQLALRVHKATGCPRPVLSNGATKTWPVIFNGRPASDSEDGAVLWIIREGLKEALTSARVEEREMAEDDEEGCMVMDG